MPRSDAPGMSSIYSGLDGEPAPSPSHRGIDAQIQQRILQLTRIDAVVHNPRRDHIDGNDGPPSGGSFFHAPPIGSCPSFRVQGC